MSASHEPDWGLLDRYLAGECSPSEVEQVRRWLDEHPESAAALRGFRAAIDRQVSAEPMPTAWNVDRAWSRVAKETPRGMPEEAGERYRLPPPLRRTEPSDVASHVDDDESVAVPSPRKSFDVGRPLRPAFSPWLRAASIILLLGGGIGLAVWRSSTRLPSEAAMATSARIITTQRSERADVRLADGTHVILAPESRLTIPAGFGATHRELTLVGEGYFDAVHDSLKPLLIHAAHSVVHDLGTRFSVRAYPEDTTVQVVVAEGRVAAGLEGTKPALTGPILERGDLARIERSGATKLMRNVDLERYQSWIEGKLHFEETPLRDVLPELARWYDVEAEVADTAVGGLRVTMTLGREPIAQVLEGLAHITNTRYERNGRMVRFSALPGMSPAPRAR